MTIPWQAIFYWTLLNNDDSLLRWTSPPGGHRFAKRRSVPRDEQKTVTNERRPYTKASGWARESVRIGRKSIGVWSTKLRKRDSGKFSIVQIMCRALLARFPPRDAQRKTDDTNVARAYIVFIFLFTGVTTPFSRACVVRKLAKSPFRLVPRRYGKNHVRLQFWRQNNDRTHGQRKSGGKLVFLLSPTPPPARRIARKAMRRSSGSRLRCNYVVGRHSNRTIAGRPVYPICVSTVRRFQLNARRAAVVA